MAASPASRTPVGDTTPLQIAGRQPARLTRLRHAYYHTAVWTGSEMIVWGGLTTAAALNTGGRYDPATDSWTATSTTNAPEARYYHTAVWTGTGMIVWGGDGATSAAT